MVIHAVRCLLLFGLVAATACGTDGPETMPSVTIDVRCGSTADCPRGFSCSAEIEHGPPITLCESSDPMATCPAGFDTKVLYGQTLCRASPPIVRSQRASRAGESARHRHPGP